MPFFQKQPKKFVLPDIEIQSPSSDEDETKNSISKGITFQSPPHSRPYNKNSPTCKIKSQQSDEELPKDVNDEDSENSFHRSKDKDTDSDEISNCISSKNKNTYFPASNKNMLKSSSQTNNKNGHISLSPSLSKSNHDDRLSPNNITPTPNKNFLIKSFSDQSLSRYTANNNDLELPIYSNRVVRSGRDSPLTSKFIDSLSKDTTLNHNNEQNKNGVHDKRKHRKCEFIPGETTIRCESPSFKHNGYAYNHNSRTNEKEKVNRGNYILEYKFCICCKSLQRKWMKTSHAKRRAFKTVFLSGIFVASTLLGLILYAHKDFISGNKIEKPYNLCTTVECVKAAADIVSSIDTTVDPCSDFYKFACGSWQKTNPIPPSEQHWDRFTDANEKLLYKVKSLLEENPKNEELRAFKNARKMYKACTDQSALTKAGVAPLLHTLESLGGFPMLNENWTDSNFDWIDVMAKLHKSFNAAGLISIYVARDEKSINRNMLYIDQGLFFDYPKLIAENNSQVREEELKIMEENIFLLLEGNKHLHHEEPKDVSSNSGYVMGSTDKPEVIKNATSSGMLSGNIPADNIGVGNKEDQLVNFGTSRFVRVRRSGTEKSTIRTEVKKGINSIGKENITEATTTSSPSANISTEVAKINDTNPIGVKSFIDKVEESDSKDKVSISTANYHSLRPDSKEVKDSSHQNEHEREKTKKNEISEGKKVNANLTPSESKMNIYQDMRDVWDFYVNIAKIMNHNYHLATDEEKYNVYTIKELKHLTSKVSNQVDWIRFFALIFDGVNVNIDDEFQVVVVTPSYFRKLPDIIKKTPKRTLANALLYLLVIELGKEIYPTVSTTHRNRQNVEPSLSARYIGPHKSRPWFSCSQRVIHFMEHAVTSLYVNKDHENYKKVVKNVQGIVNTFLNEFFETLNGTSWMDGQTKKTALEKLNKIESLVGYDEKYVEEIMVDTYYMHFPEMSETEHYSNMISARKYTSSTLLRDINAIPAQKNRWTIRNMDVNAYYTFTENAIQIPIGVLTEPMYRRNTTDALIYGSIGAIIGHEILHAFDTKGKNRNSMGILEDWWTTESLEQFSKKARCYVNSYNQLPVTLNITSLNGTLIKVDGERTKAENIADNEGIYQAWKLYKRIASMQEEETRLVGVEQFSADQLFFIQFGQIFCGNFLPNELVDHYFYGEHTPYHPRVNGIMRNSQAFASTFKCSNESNMASARRCSIW